MLPTLGRAARKPFMQLGVFLTPMNDHHLALAAQVRLAGVNVFVVETGRLSCGDRVKFKWNGSQLSPWLCCIVCNLCEGVRLVVFAKCIAGKFRQSKLACGGLRGRWA